MLSLFMGKTMLRRYLGAITIFCLIAAAYVYCAYTKEQMLVMVQKRDKQVVALKREVQNLKETMQQQKRQSLSDAFEMKWIEVGNIYKEEPPDEKNTSVDFVFYGVDLF